MEIVFYEKPGCINNTKQKKLLEEKGYSVIPVSILTHPWEKTVLRQYFGNLPVDKWFNVSAPAIKNGEIDYTTFNEAEALDAMIINPLLIKRPLINANGRLAVGFDNELVELLLEGQDISHLLSCPNIATNNNCN
jgi:nitrogenase-associated protein